MSLHKLRNTFFVSDVSMNTLYAEGKGKVFQQMMSWLSSGDEDLQTTGVLAMGNFARTGKYRNKQRTQTNLTCIRFEHFTRVAGCMFQEFKPSR
jgi:hypothetical protein